MHMSLFKKGIAEFVGTLVLVFISCGVATLTGGSIVPTALAFGLSIVAMAYTIGKVSGCHINPAVSLAMLINKKMTLVSLLGYLFLVFLCF
jgi:aquaporin Z